MKKKSFVLIFFLALFIGIGTCNAVPKTYNRDDLNNYGVNKKWKITNKNKNNVVNSYAVDADEKIYDFSGVLEDDEIKKLKREIEDYTDKTNFDMVILIDDLSYYSDDTNETFAVDFYDYNDFGIDFDHYSGILLFRNTYQSKPYFNIYTFGEAQLYYRGMRTEYILDDIYDDLHAGNYYDGFLTFIDEASEYYDKGIPNENNKYFIDDMGYLKRKYSLPIFLAILIAGIITLITELIMISKNKMIIKATAAKEYLNNESINITKSNNIFLHKSVSSYTVSSSSGGGGSHGGSSGGGHSSGGGRHG